MERDWSAEEKKARKALRKSNAEILSQEEEEEPKEPGRRVYSTTHSPYDLRPNWGGMPAFPPRVGKTAPRRWAAVDQAALLDCWARLSEIKAETERIEARSRTLGPRHIKTYPPLDLTRVDIFGRPQQVRGSTAEQWRYRHRGQVQKLHGTNMRFGPPPKRRKDEPRYYVGYEPGKVGRPRKAEKPSNAEKQRRYRQRKKLKGKT
jgi:hypothetical protein